MAENELSAKAKNLASWLGVEFKVTLFGVTVLHWKFPPDSTSGVEIKQ